ncbi:hypothetical protein DAPPUDRAFT_229353 [Daphnia pulex]|uniref:CXXC-type zinc finger protein 1 n=1 Tax=Daphnia pulex TaxID=6669 RepID=E9HNH3_DAPPU|nr:hypothetical protein DAPPUDRAFT_229353 [Daphnia pulex]|eukprot:EFX66713.1 hypothetical protein DAPPUDRAFT_229353 [Daphnia pulex]
MSKDYISKHHTLPERQSKIDLMMRQEEHGLEEQVYCICRSSDASRFMIGCDYCEDWYHGDCIDITEEESRFIKKFFCPKCRQRDPSLTIKYKQKKLEQAGKEEAAKKAKKRQEKKESTPQYPHCGECIACYRVDNCNKCDACKGKSRQQCKYRVCLTFAPKQKKVEIKSEEDEPVVKPVLKEANYSDDDVWEPSLRKEKPPVPTPKPSRHSTNKKEKTKGRYRSSATTGEHRRRKRITSSTDSEGESEVEKSPARNKQKVIHCYGPQCINASRPGSKYCSDQCGLKLATTRIYQILPQRIQEWGLTPCIAEEKNKKELEQIRKQQTDAREALEDLDLKQKELDVITAKAKKFTVDINSDDEADEGGDGETESATVQCVTCGIGVTQTNAIRHMERCFNKYESQTSFGSIFQTKIEGNNMFCDFYNPNNRTYCKRLRVLCPEHCKDPKVNDTDVCGYPSVRNVFDETGEFCLIQKKKCVKHNNWEKLRRAEIDMERVRQWLKLDELFEKERQIRTAMAQRAGLLPLILHSTFNHELMQQQQQQYAGQTGVTSESSEAYAAANKKLAMEDDT